MFTNTFFALHLFMKICKDVKSKSYNISPSSVKSNIHTRKRSNTTIFAIIIPINHKVITCSRITYPHIQEKRSIIIRKNIVCVLDSIIFIYFLSYSSPKTIKIHETTVSVNKKLSLSAKNGVLTCKDHTCVWSIKIYTK